jgi:hypothetical protein
MGYSTNSQPDPVPLKGITNVKETFKEGLISEADIVINAQNRDASTSTLRAGCIETYATSSATKVSFVMNTQATTTLGGVESDGMMLWVYGSCP